MLVFSFLLLTFAFAVRAQERVIYEPSSHGVVKNMTRVTESHRHPGRPAISRLTPEDVQVLRRFINLARVAHDAFRWKKSRNTLREMEEVTMAVLRITSVSI